MEGTLPGRGEAAASREDFLRAIGPVAFALRWACLVALAQHLSAIIAVIYIVLIRHLRGRAGQPTDPTTVVALLGSLLIVLWLSHGALLLKRGRGRARCAVAARVAIVLGIVQMIACLGVSSTLDVVVLQYAMFPACILFITFGGWESIALRRSDVTAGFEG